MFPYEGKPVVSTMLIYNRVNKESSAGRFLFSKLPRCRTRGTRGTGAGRHTNRGDFEPPKPVRLLLAQHD